MLTSSSIKLEVNTAVSNGDRNEVTVAMTTEATIQQESVVCTAWTEGQSQMNVIQHIAWRGVRDIR